MGSEGSLRSSLSAVVDVTNSILSYMGYELVSTLEDSSKPHLEPGTMPYTPEQEFGEMTLSDYDSNEDADYEPSESEDSDSVATMPSLESNSANVQPVVYQKFGEMELPEDEEDGDYSPSESDSDDSLEWASETERTIAEDELAEGKVGLDFFGAAFSVATEYLASYKPVQLGLGVATILPVSSEDSEDEEEVLVKEELVEEDVNI